MPAEPRNPKVFVSYSHDSDEHREWVLGLSERLRKEGFETMIDQYVQGTPLQGWPRWIENQIDWAEFVLVVCTEPYHRRFRGIEEGVGGRGVDLEGALISADLYISKQRSTKFVPVLRAASDEKFIPSILRVAARYLPSEKESCAKLIDFLAGVAGVEPGPVGPPPARSRRRGSASPIQPPAPAPEPPMIKVEHVAPGGTMQAGNPFYVERTPDARAQAAAQRRCETLVIKAPRQFGKSSLLNRYLEASGASGKKVVYLDFSTFEEKTIANYIEFLTRLAALLTARLNSMVQARGIHDQQDFSAYVENTLLPTVEGSVVFAFDEVDLTLRQSYAGDFFSMLRSWHNDRRPGTAWSRLSLALVSSSEPKLYIRDPLRSPFNVGERLELNAFTLPEVKKLGVRYGGQLSDSEYKKVYELLGGHPYLTQEAYYRLFGPGPISFDELVRKSADDDGPFGDHLRATYANLRAADGLLPALKRVIEDGRVESPEHYYRLNGAGLVRKEERRFVPANRIYSDFFANL